MGPSVVEARQHVRRERSRGVLQKRQCLKNERTLRRS